MKRQLLAATTLATFVAAGTSNAALLYKEGFVPTNNGVDNQPLNDPAVGWSAYDDDGTNLSGSTSNPSRITIDVAAPDGDGHRLFMGSSSNDEIVLISDAPVILSSQRDGDLAFSFQHRDSDGSGQDSSYSVIARVGGTWYSTDFISTNTTSSWVTETITVETATWYTWETDLTDGFPLPNTGGSGGTLSALAGGGDIIGFGILLEDQDNNDTFRIDDVQINGTVPEPGSLALLGIGGLCMLKRRWRA